MSCRRCLDWWYWGFDMHPIWLASWCIWQVQRGKWGIVNNNPVAFKREDNQSNHEISQEKAVLEICLVLINKLQTSKRFARRCRCWNKVASAIAKIGHSTRIARLKENRNIETAFMKYHQWHSWTVVWIEWKCGGTNPAWQLSDSTYRCKIRPLM